MELENVITVYRQKLQNALNDCKIDGRVIDQIIGTTIIRFIVELGIGVVGITLTKREDDLSSILGFQDEVITSIIPSISRGVTCAVDIPNPVTRVVYLEEIENHHSFVSSKSPTTFAVGLDIYGQPVVGSMKDMPHLLVGGTTGSGKSVFLNSMITSMVCNTCPDRLELILIDPKGNEFSNYKDIPHLVTPVIQDSKKAIRLLDTLVEYMDKRFEFLTEHGFKDITSFNESNTMTDRGNCLPTMVIVIDELADLMMASNKAVEVPISRIAGKARACGMHLVLATQRPDRNVLTGLIKANIPSIIGFKVKDKINARIISDGLNAEKLLGKGDMLYHPVGARSPVRLQGCYVSDAEIAQRMADVKAKYGVAEYRPGFMVAIEQAGTAVGTYTSNLYSQVYAGGINNE